MQNKIIFNTISVEDLLSKIKEVISQEIKKLKIESTVEDGELITIKEVCQLTGACKATIHNWKNQGILPFYRIGRKVKFKRSEVLNSMKKIERKELS